MKIYGTEYKCAGCNGIDFRLLKNVYDNSILKHPHFEAICINCSRGMVVKPLED